MLSQGGKTPTCLTEGKKALGFTWKITTYQRVSKPTIVIKEHGGTNMGGKKC